MIELDWIFVFRLFSFRSTLSLSLQKVYAESQHSPLLSIFDGGGEDAEAPPVRAHACSSNEPGQTIRLQIISTLCGFIQLCAQDALFDLDACAWPVLKSLTNVSSLLKADQLRSDLVFPFHVWLLSQRLPIDLL